MTEHTWLIWDIAALVILISAVSVCARKGFLRAVLGFVAAIASAIGAAILSAPLAYFIYDMFVREIIHSSITRQVSAQLEQGMIGAGNWMNALPAWASRLVPGGQNISAPAADGEILPAVEVFVDAVLAEPVTMILRSVCFFLLFWILLAIGRRIVWALKFVDDIPLVGTANTLLGGLLGVGWAAIIMYVLVLVVGVYIAVSGGGSAIVSKEAMSRGYLFGFFYRLIG